MSLVLDSVSVRYRHTQALKSVSLTIDPGEVVCLAGPNGAGKSTLLRLVAGLERPGSGTVALDGRPLESADAAFVSNPPPLFPYLTVREHLALTCDLWCVGGDRVEATIEAHALHLLVDRVPEQLSLGQRQRVAFAVFALARPSIWLLDEPFNALDAASSSDVKAIIEEHARTGGIVVVATHIIEALSGAATRVLWLQEGAVIHDGPVADDLVARFDALVGTPRGAGT